MIKKILQAIDKFELDLRGKTVLTEAASGNYTVTPVIAARAGADVHALAKNSGFGTIDEVTEQVCGLAKKMGIVERVNIITTLDAIHLDGVDIVTNCGFLRPIDRSLLSRLSSHCVIPLMYEPWEFRETDLDLQACRERGIKVYGTNEQDSRLRTMEYIGYTVLSLLLARKIAPFGAAILLTGCNRFVTPVENVLLANGYDVTAITEYNEPPELEDLAAIVVLEHERDVYIIGRNRAFIQTSAIPDETLVIHISGRIDFENAGFDFVPPEPREFGNMSYTTDFIDNRAVIDLHTAGLKVGEGMLKTNKLGLSGHHYKSFMEENYPSLAFSGERYW